MKSRIISAVVIAAFIAAVCVFTSLYTARFADELTQSAEKIYINEESSISEIANLDKKWEMYSEIASYYIYHDEIEEVTSLISGLREAYHDSETIFKINCKEIELIMEHINEGQKPKLNNIF